MKTRISAPVKRRDRPSQKALLVVTLAFAAMLLAANLATPLYAVYAKQFGFSTAVLALIFAVYALVLIPSLLTFGQISDRFGRKPALAEVAGPSETRRAALLATLAQAGGSAAGVLLAGALAQWGPSPGVLPFVAGMVICAIAAAALVFLPETTQRAPGGLALNWLYGAALRPRPLRLAGWYCWRAG